MKNDKISVIVPVYNVEKYLDECIQSIVTQSYENLEILLVDDGSSDNCPAICDGWAKKDKRIKVIHKKNGGAGSARNTGIENSTGEWVGFIDGDDSVEEKFFETLLSNADEKEADICACDFKYCNADGTSAEKYCYDTIKMFSSQELLREFFECCKGQWVSFCNKIIRKDLLDNFTFPENCYFEDWCMAPVLYSKAERILYFPEAMYNYNFRNNSAVHTYSVKRYADCVAADVYHFNYFNQQNISDYNDKIKAFMRSDFKKCIKAYSLKDKQLIKETYKLCSPVLNSRTIQLLATFPLLFHFIYVLIRKLK